jgi:cell division protein FtsB
MMITVVAILAVGLVFGVLAYHGIGSALDARQARKELDERIAQLEQVAESASTTKGRRARRLMERHRPIGSLLAAVRDEPTVRLS